MSKGKPTKSNAVSYVCSFSFPCAHSEGAHGLKVALTDDGLLKSITHKCSAPKGVADSLGRLGLLTCSSAKEIIKDYVTKKVSDRKRYGHDINTELGENTSDDDRSEFSLSKPIVHTLDYAREAGHRRIVNRAKRKAKRDKRSYKSLASALVPEDKLLLSLTEGLNRKAGVRYPEAVRRLTFLVMESKEAKGFVNILVLPRGITPARCASVRENMTEANVDVSTLLSFAHIRYFRSIDLFMGGEHPTKNEVNRTTHHVNSEIRSLFSEGYRHYEKTSRLCPLELVNYSDGWCACTGKKKSYSSSIKTHVSTKKHINNIQNLRKNIAELTFKTIK